MLKIVDVFKSYGKKQVLKGVTFSVKKNEIKALIGINGAGKSTLVEMITGIKSVEKNKIFIDGIDISNKAFSKKIKSIFGYMPQSFCMFNDLTVRENLGYVCSIFGVNESKIEEVAKKCELSTYLDTLAKNLSGGYRQLLSMAIAIVHSPKILILDEPTSAMDPLFRRKFWGIVNDFKNDGGTVLLITHYIEELLECDSFACLSNGKIAIDKSVESVKNQNFINIEKILESCK